MSAGASRGWDVAWHRPDDPAVPLVVLLHGRGSDEREIVRLADVLVDGPSYAALRAPIAEGAATPGSPTAASAGRCPSRSPRR